MTRKGGTAVPIDKSCVDDWWLRNEATMDRFYWWVCRWLVPTPPAIHALVRQYESLTPSDERLVFLITMGHEPSWGRFMAYVSWLQYRYDPSQAYEHFRYIVTTYPQYVPYLKQGMWKSFLRWCVGQYDKQEEEEHPTPGDDTPNL